MPNATITQTDLVSPSYPAMFGRRVIYTDQKSITRDNLLSVLNDALLIHSLNELESDYLRRYYRGDQPILGREKAFRPEINNRIVENRANEIVAFKTGYLMGEPLQYISRSSDERISDDIAKLNSYAVAEDKECKDRELAEWMYNCGVGYRMVLPVEEGEDKELSPFHIYTRDPRLTFNVYYSGLSHKCVMGVAIIVTSSGSRRYCIYTDKMYYEVFEGEIEKSEPHALEEVPIIEYPLNNTRLGAFEIVLPLLDSLNNLDSNRMDGIEQFIQAILVFVNSRITKEKLEALYPLGAIEINSETGLPADVKYLVQELNQSQTQITKDDIYNSILTICGMPNRNGGSSTSDTGRAVIMRDGWSDAEARAKNDELMFKSSEKRFLRLIIRIASQFNGINLKVSDIDIRFTRRNYENITEKSNVLTNMLSNNKIHPSLAFTHCGLFVDPEMAYKMSMEYQKELASTKEGEGDIEPANQPGNNEADGNDPQEREPS